MNNHPSFNAVYIVVTAGCQLVLVLLLAPLSSNMDDSALSVYATG